MSIAEVIDLPLTRQRLVPPSPPRAPDSMTAFGRIRATRINPIQAWGNRVEIVRGSARETREHPDPLTLLGDFLAHYRAPALAGLPRFCGGAVG